MAKGHYSPEGLISRQAALHDSRLIVAIPSQEGVRIPDEDEGGWRKWEHPRITQPDTLYA